MRGDRGSGTVLVTAVIGVVLALLLGALALVHAATAGTTARTAADLGALAGADRLVNGTSRTSPGGGSDPCGSAGEVVRANGGALLDCDISGEVVTVRVAVRTDWPGLGRATARSRAGPTASSGGEAGHLASWRP